MQFLKVKVSQNYRRHPVIVHLRHVEIGGVSLIHRKCVTYRLQLENEIESRGVIRNFVASRIVTYC